LKSRQATLKALLDTPFILPSLGIDVGKKVTESLKKLADLNADIHFSHFSIIEALWVAARLSKNTNLNQESFRIGLRSILESRRYIKVEEDSEVFNQALKLYVLGHKDMIDNILYASSVCFNLTLITLDTELKEFIHSRGLRDTLTSPNQIS